MQRDLDVVIFGATGYTGEHVARAFQQLGAGGWSVKWAVAGRSQSA